MAEKSESQDLENQFIGRSKVLGRFQECLEEESAKKGIYYYGEGGLGKTWILRRIFLDCQADPRRAEWEAFGIIDFYDTEHHSIRGLQTTLRSRLQLSEAFDAYEEALTSLDAKRQSGEGINTSMIASLEARANRRFIECCQQALKDRQVILLFDTFERVQNQDVGRWLLQDLLPASQNVRFAISGRPEPQPAPMPEIVDVCEVEGFDRQEARDFLRQRWPEIPIKKADLIWRRTGGAPLILNLILDLGSVQQAEFVTKLGDLEPKKRVQDSEELQQELVTQFTDITSKTNIAMWAMSFLWRRFDLGVLKYMIEKGEWFRSGEYEVVFHDLCGSPYVKDYPSTQSHLLHDEIRRMIAQFVLARVDSKGDLLRKPLYELIVNQYYPEQIERADPDLKRQLGVERLGYLLDVEQESGLHHYQEMQAEIERTRDYALEELAWTEMRDFLDRLQDEDDLEYKIYADRGELLRRHGLFQKAETHYHQMIDRFPNHLVDAKQEFGFMLLRQGKITDAEQTFRDCLALVEPDDFTIVAEIENNLGQTARRAGHWDEALEHYRQSIRMAMQARDNLRLVEVYVNRGYLWALQGHYEDAKRQCRLAIQLLGQIPEEEQGRNEIYACMNLGSAYRYAGEYEQAGENYQRSLELAESANDLEAVCNAEQHLGINEHMQGRKIRRELLGQDLGQIALALCIPECQQRLKEACQRQLRAWEYLVPALDIAYSADWREAIASGLLRLARVCREVHRIRQLVSRVGHGLTVPDLVAELDKKVSDYVIPLEIEYETQLLTPGLFSEQPDWLHRAIRLFDLAAFVADEVSDFHRSLDTLMELARLFDELGANDQVREVLQRTENIKAFGYQEELFTIMNKITRGNLYFAEGDQDDALSIYKDSYADLANQSGYATVLLADRLRDLRWRFEEELSSQTALEWCDVLETAWQAHLLDSNKWPMMLAFLEDARLKALSRQDTQV